MPPKKPNSTSSSTKAQSKQAKESPNTRSHKRKAPASTDDNQPLAKTTKKAKTSAKHPKESSSKSAIGSKHDPSQPPAPQASATRLPSEGQSVTWRAMPGWVEGTVLEILRDDKEVEGKKVKATKDDPRVVLKSSAKSGKICVHKPQAIYFE